MRGRRKQARPKSRPTQQPLAIAEKVRFWEEQDRINQTLIPRVIRQHELLTKHIEEHDDLPELFGRQLADALEEQSRRFEKERRESLDNQSELFRRELLAALDEQSRRFEKERESLDNQSELFRRELLAALDEQSRRFEKELRAALLEQSRRVRLLRWLVTGAFVVSLTAIIVALWA